MKFDFWILFVTWFVTGGVLVLSGSVIAAYYLNWFKRDWKLIDVQVLPSAWEQQMAAKCLSFKADNVAMPNWLFRKLLVQTYQCQLTKRIKVVRSQNP
jgi:hypothetical protein